MVTVIFEGESHVVEFQEDSRVGDLLAYASGVMRVDLFWLEAVKGGVVCNPQEPIEDEAEYVVRLVELI